MNRKLMKERIEWIMQTIFKYRGKKQPTTKLTVDNYSVDGIEEVIITIVTNQIKNITSEI